jgi:hypothetical protein
MSDIVKKDDFYSNIREILQTARNKTYKRINFIMVEAYWNIGKQIVQEEQNGEDRAKYGSALIKELSKKLTLEFGKGFTSTNLKMMRQFYNTFANSHALCDQLTWSHYRLLIRIQNQKAGKLVNLSGIGTVRKVANNFGRITEMWDEYFDLQRKIYT